MPVRYQKLLSCFNGNASSLARCSKPLPVSTIGAVPVNNCRNRSRLAAKKSLPNSTSITASQYTIVPYLARVKHRRFGQRMLRLGHEAASQNQAELVFLYLFLHLFRIVVYHFGNSFGQPGG